MKHLLLSTLAIIFSMGAIAQSLEVTESLVEVAPDAGVEYEQITLTNVSSETITVVPQIQVRCYAFDQSSVDWCFPGTCLPGIQANTEAPSNFHFELEPGGTTNEIAIHLADYAGEGSAWRMVYYNADNPADQAYVDVIFGDCSEEFVVVSVEEFQQTSFKFFPNPADNMITIDFETTNQASYKIYDLTGKVVAAENTSSSRITVETSHLLSGLYFIEVDGIRKRLVIR
ncbi:T9SS type A sorting domain-containing protein [Sanyastnella coralliicola]|uniref:T9SS type A sorting domain-containing protein n=1 Tax=Sanyastnella coralliicola TaxID=3069118 RepID=UPI0027BA6F6F|nr:T9SS type A sorting domain-containing protein [Longitalea sp. SCSIO 12813]